MCCIMYSKEPGECKLSCLAETKKVDLDPATNTKCLDQKDGENNNIKLNACKSCCESNRSIYISDGSMEACNNDC